jgi:hypothetical protein
MKIFVGYGYNPRDAWIEDLVFPLIEAFGDEVTSGKEIAGQNLDSGVRAEIARSHALIGFTTRREPIGNTGEWTTHQWVKDELATAVSAQPPIPFVEVRETQVDRQGGILGGRARITFDEQHRDRCLVELAQAIGSWHRLPIACQIELMPEDFAREVRPLLRRGPGALRCSYHVLAENGTEEGPENPTAILALPGRLAIRTGPVSQDASILIKIRDANTNQLLWISDWHPVKSQIIHLEKIT